MLWFGARLVVENKLSPGELSTFVIYAVYVGSNVGQLAGIVSSLVQVMSEFLKAERGFHLPVFHYDLTVQLCENVSCLRRDVTTKT